MEITLNGTIGTSLFAFDGMILLQNFGHVKITSRVSCILQSVKVPVQQKSPNNFLLRPGDGAITCIVMVEKYNKA